MNAIATPNEPNDTDEKVLSFSDHNSVNRLIISDSERNKLLEQYLPLVGEVVAKLRRGLPSHIDADDLYSVGVTGLIAAVRRFDPIQQGTFATYVRLRIRGAILDELRRLDPCPRRSRARNKKIQIAIQEIEQELGRAPTNAEISTRLQISAIELAHWREAGSVGQLISLDFRPETSTTPGSSLHELVADEHQECVRETMEKQELVKLLSERITMLPDKQKQILALYYFEGMCFSEIAVVFGLTESRICQIHKQALARLRKFIRPLANGNFQSPAVA